MKLQLCVKNNLIAEKQLEEISFSTMNFKARYEVQKVYIQTVVDELKFHYTKFLETRDWQIFLIVESKVNLINEQ